ncbi:unnamed protein product, partial [Musa acuminata var. zebrina]
WLSWATLRIVNFGVPFCCIHRRFGKGWQQVWLRKSL